MFDDDGLAPVDDTDGLHPQRTTGSRLDGAHRDLQRPLGHRAVERLTNLLDLDAEGVGDHSDLALPLTRDRAGEADPRLVVERTAESQCVAHDVGHTVVVVQPDLVGVDLLDLRRLRGSTSGR